MTVARSQLGVGQALGPRGPLERIKLGRNHDAFPTKLVNPLDIKKLEQIVQVDGSPPEIPNGAIPINLDLLQGRECYAARTVSLELYLSFVLASTLLILFPGQEVNAKYGM